MGVPELHLPVHRLSDAGTLAASAPVTLDGAYRLDFLPLVRGGRQPGCHFTVEAEAAGDVVTLWKGEPAFTRGAADESLPRPLSPAQVAAARR